MRKLRLVQQPYTIAQPFYRLTVQVLQISSLLTNRGVNIGTLSLYLRYSSPNFASNDFAGKTAGLFRLVYPLLTI